MVRTFHTHHIRKQTELTGILWDFKPLSGEHKDEIYPIATPCCWESHPDFSSYRGEGEYTTKFYAEGNIHLEFKGVSHTATVTLDGIEIARHYNAYTIFDALVKNLEKGEHILTIKADNRFSEASALHIPNDYMSYGGVSRPVILEQLKDIYIERFHILPHKNADDVWEASFEISLHNLVATSNTVDLRIDICEKNALQTVVASKNIPSITLQANERLTLSSIVKCPTAKEWSWESPNLYFAKITVMHNEMAIDDLIDQFGFREIAIQGKDILMNGKPIRIKGVCRHEDHPQYGCAIPYHAMAYDLNLIHDLGANSIRTVHYPNDELFLDLCDEMGILVWEENHARGLSEEDMKNPNFEPQAENVIREMIRDHYNHPSIYIWGILNECASETEYGKSCYAKQFHIIHELDPSRPASFASCKFKTDICLDLPDVVSYNIYPQWYLNTPVDEYFEDLYNWIQTETDGSGKPFLITEIGAGGLYGYHNPEHSRWTEEYQAQALEKQITAILENSNCIGLYIWQFCDVRVSEEWFQNRPRTMNNKGIVDEFRRKKMCYEIVKHLYHTLE